MVGLPSLINDDGTVSGPASKFSEGPLTLEEKKDIRRFMGYQDIGNEAAGRSSWRFFNNYGQNEWRMQTLSGPGCQQVRWFLSQLYPLEEALLLASDNLDTDKAAVWTHNKAELHDRNSLFTFYRKQLCSYMGLPPGPGVPTASNGQVLV